MLLLLKSKSCVLLATLLSVCLFSNDLSALVPSSAPNADFFFGVQSAVSKLNKEQRSWFDRTQPFFDSDLKALRELVKKKEALDESVARLKAFCDRFDPQNVAFTVDALAPETALILGNAREELEILIRKQRIRRNINALYFKVRTRVVGQKIVIELSALKGPVYIASADNMVIRKIEVTHDSIYRPRVDQRREALYETDKILVAVADLAIRSGNDANNVLLRLQQNLSAHPIDSRSAFEKRLFYDEEQFKGDFTADLEAAQSLLPEEELRRREASDRLDEELQRLQSAYAKNLTELARNSETPDLLKKAILLGCEAKAE